MTALRYYRLLDYEPVSAEQFTKFSVPRGVEGYPLALTGKTVFTFHDGLTRAFIFRGDWIVTEDDGPQYVVPADVFQKSHARLHWWRALWHTLTRRP